MNATAKNLNKLQLHFLQFFSEKEVTDEETKDIKNMVSKYYFEKAQNAIEQAMSAKNINVESLETNKNLHFRASKK